VAAVGPIATPPRGGVVVRIFSGRIISCCPPYGKSGIVYSGPLYKAMNIDGDKVRLRFAHAAKGLRSRDTRPLTEFEIAGADGKFVPAKAIIDGETVVVQAAGVPRPTQVRFGWRNVANPNLMNSEGLPASPFRTENWQGGTGE
jgi:sialate O-acetylesterase